MAFGCDRSMMECDDFLCNRKSKSGPARVGAAGLVHPIETLKYFGQLFLRDGRPLVFKGDHHLLVLLFGGDNDFRIWKAICRRIFQNVIEYTGQLHRIAADAQIFISMKNSGISFCGQDGVKLVHHLHQHIVKVNLLLLQRDLLQIIPGDFKKLVYQPFQAVGLVQRDMDIFCFLLRRHIRRFVQQA